MLAVLVVHAGCGTGGANQAAPASSPRRAGTLSEQGTWRLLGDACDVDVRVALAVESGEERFDHVAVELRARPDAQLRPGRVLAQRGPVDAIGGHGLVSVGDGEDPSLERDPLGIEALGVAGAVGTFVVGEDPAGEVAELGPGEK